MDECVGVGVSVWECVNVCMCVRGVSVVLCVGCWSVGVFVLGKRVLVCVGRVSMGACIACIACLCWGEC